MEYNRTHHAFFLIANAYDWHTWANDYSGYNKPRAFKTNINVGDGLRVSVVELKADTREKVYGDEYAQGSEADTHILFRVDFPDGTTEFFRKRGAYDSYGDASWDGKFEPVKPVEKTITVYELA